MPHIPASHSSLDSEKKASPRPPLPKPTSYRTWLLVVWPLILHVILTIVIVAFVTFYVDHRDFNLEQRRPWVKLADGTMRPWVHYAPLQTDITTTLSLLIAVLRLVTACWLGPLCWRCAFVLMEESGLRPTHLRALVSYGITPTLPSGAPGKNKRLLRFLVWTALLVVLPVHLAAPILTGSIRWVSSNPPPEHVSHSTIGIRTAVNYDTWNYFIPGPGFFGGMQFLAEHALYRSFMTWGRDTSNNAFKRFTTSLSGLEVNSTVANVTIPYFTVQAIEWIDNPHSTMRSNEYSIDDIICPKLNMGGSYCPIRWVGSLALIPDTPWTNRTSESPSMVTERRLMVYNSHSIVRGECIQGGKFNPGPNVSFHQERQSCWVFAWVTYSAGAAVCSNCRITSYATLQNDTALFLQEAYFTPEALRLAPSVVTEFITAGETHGTLPTWNTINEYVIGMLTRSYTSAWMLLNDVMAGPKDLLYTNYSVSPHATRALVNFLRVYIWLGLQCLVTLSGILFLYIQAQSSSPLIVDTALAVFHLDSSALHDGAYNQFWGGAARKVELDGDYLRVKAE